MDKFLGVMFLEVFFLGLIFGWILIVCEVIYECVIFEDIWKKCLVLFVCYRNGYF